MYTYVNWYLSPPPQALRTDKEKEAGRHEEEGQEITDRHIKDMQEIGQRTTVTVHVILTCIMCLQNVRHTNY